MIEKPNSSHTLGLELEGSTLKAAFLSLLKGKPKLDLLFDTKIDETKELPHEINFNDVKPLYIEKIELGQIKNLINQNLVATCLNGNLVLTRNLEIKLKKEKDILAALPFQVEPILPFPYENGLIDKINIDQTADSTELTILAVKKESIKAHIEDFQKIQIEPEVISSESSALTAFSNHFFKESKTFFIVYFKENYVTGTLVKNNKLLASQSIFFKKVSLDRTENELNEVTRIIYSLSKQIKTLEVQDVLVFGASQKTEDLLLKNLSKINKKIRSLEADPNFNLLEDELKKFAVPIGLCLQTLPTGKDAINFRQDELAYPDPWKHLKKPIAIFLALGMFLSIAFYLFGEAYLANYEDEIKKEYITLLSNMHKPYHVFESEYLAKFPSGSDTSDEISITNLTQEDISGRLKFLYNEVQTAPDMFPLFPNLPRVSDVLAFLANHPNIVDIDVASGTTTPLIQLESFAYTMVKKPDQTKKQEKYQVKVEFEFNTATPKLAREFHDALIAPNAIVDPKGEVKWSSNRGKYKTSFFLKDRTSYPSTRL